MLIFEHIRRLKEQAQIYRELEAMPSVPWIKGVGKFGPKYESDYLTQRMSDSRKIESVNDAHQEPGNTDKLDNDVFEKEIADTPCPLAWVSPCSKSGSFEGCARDACHLLSDCFHR